jgi:hypothetical protein
MPHRGISSAILLQRSIFLVIFWISIVAAPDKPTPDTAYFGQMETRKAA